MLRLDMQRGPAWHDMPGGVRLKMLPITTAMMIEARRDPDVQAALARTEAAGSDDTEAPTAADTEQAIAFPFAVALARLAIVEWEGVGDAEGRPVDPTPETVAALMEVWPIFEAFQSRHVGAGLLLEQEKNASSPLPNGRSAAARSTARPAQGRARTARGSKTGR